MAFRAVQVIPKTIEVAEQQLLAQGDEAQLSNDTFLNVQHVRAFLEVAMACAAFDILTLRCAKRRLLKNDELICGFG